ncbi:MAG TPA: hypothetical protein K8V25_04890 [Megamonas hypermegale]|nr:hypothetical protein [Megamonas hypermegale]
MMKRICLLFVVLLSSTLSSLAQTFVEIGKTYPVTADGDKYVVNGFNVFNNKSDELIFTNALLWAVENICPQLREGITEVDIPNKNFSCDFTLGSMANSGMNNIYYVKATFRVTDGKLLYYISDVLIESSAFIMKKVTPLEKLTPEKRESHQKTMDDFIKSESLILNKMFDFVTTNQPDPITHWSDIAISRPVEGMNEDECRLAFGKPQSIMETNGEVQWMYSSSFYLFFENGLVKTIIK